MREGGRERPTLLLMFLARYAYGRVARDSSKCVLAGLMWAIVAIRLFPPRASCSVEGASWGWWEPGLPAARGRHPSPTRPGLLWTSPSGVPAPNPEKGG